MMIKVFLNDYIGFEAIKMTKHQSNTGKVFARFFFFFLPTKKKKRYPEVQVFDPRGATVPWKITKLKNYY